jgi:hypothetical protein
MAELKIFRGGIQEDMPSNARIQPQDFGESGIAAGLKVAGRAVANVADDMAEIQDIHDHAAVKEQVNALNQHYAEIGYTGPNAYYSKAGKDAVDTRPMVEKSLDSFIEQSRANLNENQRRMFDDAVIPQRQQWAMQIATYADKETKRYGAQESEARQNIAAEQAKLSYFQDPEAGEKLIDTGLSEIDAQAKLEGWGPETVAAKKIAFTSGTYRDIGTRLAYEGGETGPQLAQAFVEKHQASMTADDREVILTHARVQQNSLEADKRRQEAEQRRIERENRADAKDRAKSVADNIDLGIPLSGPEYAAALSDAQASGDEALVKRLQVGQFKNNLTVQYNGSPPSELQSRINQLDGEIAKAGGKVKPEVMVERDHLQGLLNKSNSELANDPLSWGARHLGVDPGRLNMDDPASVRQRITAANEVARRTGRAPTPLTNEEAAAWATTPVHGTVADKVKLVARLARFGPMALAAAEQVAPNNTGFQNLVGLATHPNASVAHFRVNQVVSGYEILKTKPKLIDKDMSVRQFQESVGNALHFFPSTAQGVYSNATAILASDANEHGWDQWSQAQGRWYAAVNMALGAYTKDGKQYGGLAKFNGGTTVLPEDIDQATFEQRIARAHGTEFRKASNGTPMFGDGRIPIATDLKKMLWVPSGDGVYRLSDGNAFLKTKSGDFYEIDFSRLH